MTDARVQPEALSALSPFSAPDARRDPVNLVRRLQRSLQLQERFLEVRQPLPQEQTFVKRFFQSDRDNRSL